MPAGRDTLIGTSLGPYEITALIGAGGMGEVYRARDTRLGRTVAVKIVREHLERDASLPDRFDREARILSRLNHPHICAIYDVGRDAGVDYLVMEYLEGETLDHRLASSPLSFEEAMTWAIEIADALDTAHRAGITHRDLKPANVMLTRGGANSTGLHAKLLDFGLARQIGPPAVAIGDPSMLPTAAAAATMEGTILGTLQYMAPEQVEGREADVRTDIFAFGAVWYEMLTGRRAFKGESSAGLIGAILRDEPAPASSVRPIPPALDRVVRKCLEKHPDRRWQSARDLRDEMVWLTTEGTATTTREPAVTRGVWRERAAWVVAAVAVSLAAAAWIVSSRPAPAAAPEVVEFSVFPPSGTTFAAEIGAPWPSISPDGRQLAFVALAANGVSQLWLRPIQLASAQALAGTEGAARPFWSPDSRSIGFFADGNIKRLDRATGTVQKICDAPYLGGMSATWGVGDVIIFTHVGGIFRVAASGDTPVLAFPNRGTESDRNQRQNPSFLPDGRRFVFDTYRSRPEDDEICVASLDTKEEQCIAKVASPARYAAPGYLLLVRDGALRLQRFDADRLALSGEAIPVTTAPVRVSPVFRPPPFSIAASALAFHPGAAAAQLEWRDRTGATVSVLGELGEYENSSASADGRWVATTRTDARGNMDIWLNDKRLGAWQRFTFDDGADNNPLFSPDGSSIVYTSAQAAGRGGLYIKPTSGAGRERRLPRLEGNEMGPHDWSPDARLILFGIFSSKNSWDLGVVAADGESPPKLVIQSQHGERSGKFSRDMKWIAYDSTESGRREVWIQPYPPTGDKWQVTTTGGINPHWRQDSRELLYVAPDGMLMAVAITPGIAPTIGATTRLFQTLRREGGAGFEMSPDAQRFLLAMPASGADVTPITVRVNWRSAIDQR